MSSTDCTIGEYDYDILSANENLLTLCDKAYKNGDGILPPDQRNFIAKLRQRVRHDKENKRIYIKFDDLHKLQQTINKIREEEGSKEYLFLHQLMKDCSCSPVLPKPPVIERSPEYESKMEKLRLKLDEEEYQRMTSNVPGVIRKKGGDMSLGQEIKQMDSQIMFMFNFILTVIAAFGFGYKAVEYAIPAPNTSLQITAGLMLATVVFFADVYFIMKSYL